MAGDSLSNIADILMYQKKFRNKELTVCLYCNKPFDRTSWSIKTYTCDPRTGKHEPVKFIHNGRVLKPV